MGIDELEAIKGNSVSPEIRTAVFTDVCVQSIMEGLSYPFTERVVVHLQQLGHLSRAFRHDLLEEIFRIESPTNGARHLPCEPVAEVAMGSLNAITEPFMQIGHCQLHSAVGVKQESAAV